MSKPVAYIKAGPLNNYIVAIVNSQGQKREVACHNLATARHELAKLK